MPTMTAVAGKSSPSSDELLDTADSLEDVFVESGASDDGDDSNVDVDVGDSVDDAREVVEEMGRLVSLRKAHIPD